RALGPATALAGDAPLGAHQLRRATLGADFPAHFRPVGDVFFQHAGESPREVVEASLDLLELVNDELDVGAVPQRRRYHARHRLFLVGQVGGDVAAAQFIPEVEVVLAALHLADKAQAGLDPPARVAAGEHLEGLAGEEPDDHEVVRSADLDAVGLAGQVR